MKNKTFITALVAFISVVGNAFGQNTTTRELLKGSLTSGTVAIDSQFIYLNAISKTQEGFKIVRQANFEQIRKNVADTITALTKEIAALKANGGNGQVDAGALNDSLARMKEELRRAQQRKANGNLTYVDTLLQPNSYLLITSGVVLILLAALFFYIYRYQQSHVVTRDTKKAIEELQSEFDQHRKRAMEREQKLKRQLQDEINKRLG